MQHLNFGDHTHQMDDFAELQNKMLKGFEYIKKVPEISYQYNPRHLVFHHDKVRLFHYEARVKSRDSKNHLPLLVVFATVNRPEILDLFPQTSFIGRLLAEGQDVYLLDWGYPDLSDKRISLNDYVDYLDDCVEWICNKRAIKKINVLGICQGGLISLCYAGCADKIAKLVLISTPVDFHTPENIVGQFLTKIDMGNVVRMYGNVSGLWLTQFFITLRPFELIGKKYLRFIDKLDDDAWRENFLRVEKWLYDAPDQSGKAFLELTEDFYKKNKLIKGEIYMKGKKIDLKKIKIPLLNVMAGEDEIVPVSASKALKNYIGTNDYSEKMYPSGHIGIYISDKVGNVMPQDIAHWLEN